MDKAIVKFDIAGTQQHPITLQLGPTPGDVFAVYAQNEPYHDSTRADWLTCARAAIETWAGKKGKRLIRVLAEWDQPYNLRGEYS